MHPAILLALSVAFTGILGCAADPDRQDAPAADLGVGPPTPSLEAPEFQHVEGALVVEAPGPLRGHWAFAKASFTSIGTGSLRTVPPGTPPSLLEFETVGVGRGSGPPAIRPPPAEEWWHQAGPRRAERAGDAWTEWWSPTEHGLEHGFVLDVPPEGRGPLAISVATNLAAREGANGLVFAQGPQRWEYSGLRVWDAGGRDLPASLRALDGGFRIEIDDDGADYPIFVDPMLSTSGWTAESQETGAGLGTSLSGLGDINGDGYGDIAVGVPGSDVGGTDSGAIWIYYGTPDGIGLATDLILPGPMPGDRLGTCLSQAGDVNGDGYSDLVAGGYGTTTPGWVGLWYGGPDGPDTAPSWTYLGTQAASRFGIDCAGIGDVQNDGFSDIAVGASGWDTTGSDHGAVFVFYGATGGPGSAPVVQSAGAAAGDELGHTVTGAGDWNGDGYSDMAAGAPGADTPFPNPAADAGAVSFWFGSASGLGAGPVTQNFVGPLIGHRLGTTLCLVGDAGGDGYPELGVGRPVSSDSSYALVGGPSGPYSTVSATSSGYRWVGCIGDANGDGRADVVGGTGTSSIGLTLGRPGSTSTFGLAPVGFTQTQTNSLWSTVIAPAGDVNGDGYGDVLVGGPAWDTLAVDGGRANLYYGGAGGMLNPTFRSSIGSGQIGAGYALANAGDTNGDGYDDLVAGNPLATNEGAQVFVGSGGGLGAIPTALLASPLPGQDIGFGSAVGAAGDINGDGYSDVAVGAPGWDNGQTNEGRVQVHLGGPTGVANVASWAWEPDLVGAAAMELRGRLDANADGHADIVVGGTSVTGEQGAWAFLGTPAGLPTAPSQSFGGPTAEAAQIAEVREGGDVNCDGFDDVFLSWPLADIVGTDSGVFGLHTGSADGVSTGPVWSTGGTGASMQLGRAPARLESNGDECGDWQFGGGGGLYDSHSYIWTGNAALASGAPRATVQADGLGRTMTADGGDVDGDGLGDLATGNTAGPSTTQGGYGTVALWYSGSTGGYATYSADTGSANGDNQHVAALGDWNGDGLSDVVAGGRGTVPQNTEIFTRTANGEGTESAPQFPIVARATDPEDGSPLPPRAQSQSWNAVDLHGMGRSPYGRHAVALEAQVTDARGTWQSPALVELSGYADAFSTSVPLTAHVEGLDNEGTYQWRVRVRYAQTGAFPLIAGPWVYGGLPGERRGVHFRAASLPDTDADGYPDVDDCGPNDPQVRPGVAEVAGDEVDQNCDGAELCLEDADDDGSIGLNPAELDSTDDDCDDPFEATLAAGVDCDDGDASIGAAASEVVGDTIDQDCDGGDLCALDGDTDGFPDATGTLPSSDLDCIDLGEHDGGGLTDCNDGSSAVYPGAPESVGSSADENCDGQETCFVDADSDGYRPLVDLQITSTDADCNDPGEGLAAEPPADCDDVRPLTYPGAPETVAALGDENCDGYEACYADTDNDGYRPLLSVTIPSVDADCADAGEAIPSDPATDCNDAAAAINPGFAEGPGDEIDANCDGAENCFADADADGARSIIAIPSADLDCSDAGEALLAAPAPDCNDADPAVRPGLFDVVGDGIDQDCNGVDGTFCLADADDDGYGSGAPFVETDGSCTDDALQAAIGGDCADANPARNPGEVELPGDGVDSDCDGAELCYADSDADGFRPIASNLTTPSLDGDCSDAGEALGSAAVGDCDDAAVSVRPGAAEIAGDGIDQDCDGVDSGLCYVDADADGYGAGSPVADGDGSCADDPFQAATGSDCADGNPARNPGQTESPGDGIDSDCDGAETCFIDGDGDGYRPAASNLTVSSLDGDCADAGEGLGTSALGDCDDDAAAIRPGAVEIPGDGIDQDCDGLDTALCHLDLDGDGFGGIATQADADGSCSGLGQAPGADDCDDADAARFPGAAEVVADGIDEDCDGAEICLTDSDSDGYRSNLSSTQVLSDDPDCDDSGEGAISEPAADCDDGDPLRNPGAPEEAADGFDADCDFVESCYPDADDDGFRPAGNVIVAGADLDCDDPGEGQADDPSGDCNDLNALIHPGTGETPADGIDQDCDGGELCPADADSDGFPSPSSSVQSIDGDCLDLNEGDPGAPPDCDDLSPAVHPGAVEFDGDGRDQDCDGFDGGGACAIDADEDGAVACIDCDDSNPDVRPGAAEICDGLDSDCDQSTEEPFDDDPDGDGFTGCEGDCGHFDAWIHPGAPELCDGLDGDCSGGPASAEADGDGDGVLAPPCGADCDDGDPAAYGGAAEGVTGPERDCDGVVGALDADHDGTAGHQGDCDDGDPTIGPAEDEACDGRDTDCDGSLGPAEGADRDGDGAIACADCDDLDPERFLGAFERCDGLDSDCDQLQGVGRELDDDGDGFRGCDGDCDDGAEEVHPRRAEDCTNGIDDDCDGVADTDRDEDQDGATACLGADCDDGDPSIHPLQLDLCDGRDEDCAGGVDDGFDADGDGVTSCGGDCDDGVASIYPGAPADCGDGVDEDCFPSTLEDSDADGDGYAACAVPVPDCDEGDPRKHPAAAEGCNAEDDDCDGLIDEGWDLDGDGAAPCTFDCDEGNTEVGPRVPEVACDGIDNDCDGVDDTGDCDPERLDTVRPFGCAVGSNSSEPELLGGLALLAAAWGLTRGQRRRSGGDSAVSPGSAPT